MFRVGMPSRYLSDSGTTLSVVYLLLARLGVSLCLGFASDSLLEYGTDVGCVAISILILV